LKAAAAIEGYGAPFPRLFRPPFRSFNRTTLALMRRLHMLMVLWTVDTSDYLRPPAATIVRRVLAGAAQGRSSSSTTPAESARRPSPPYPGSWTA
jgi:peptidoglycan-N-acetylglucosamine deacetylase